MKPLAQKCFRPAKAETLLLRDEEDMYNGAIVLNKRDDVYHVYTKRDGLKILRGPMAKAFLVKKGLLLD